jgi:AhpD family alkylhydroperoxidase
VRPANVEHGHRRRNAIALKVMGAVARTEPDGVIKLSLYRPSLFGRAWVALLREVMRGPSPWSAGERELFGAYTSKLNACQYCTRAHTELAGIELGTRVTAAMLDDVDRAGFDERVLAALHVIDGSEPHPSALSAEEIDDVLAVNFVFNVVNRLANTLDFAWASDDDVTKAARVLHRVSYTLPDFLLRGP